MIRRIPLVLLLCLALAAQTSHGVESSYEPDFSPMRNEAARLHEEGRKLWKTHNRREKEEDRPAEKNNTNVKTKPRPEKEDSRPAARNTAPDASLAPPGQGDAAAQRNADIMHLQDLSAPRDDAHTVLWLTQAAEQGDAHAQCVLGTLYALGQGVPKDDAKAARLYEKAAEQKHAEAQYALGWMYAQGRGVPRDEVKAVRWCLKAAEQGIIAHASCQKLRSATRRP